MKFAWMPEGADKRYCLFLIKEDGVKIKIKDPKYKETRTMGIEQLKKMV